MAECQILVLGVSVVCLVSIASGDTITLGYLAGEDRRISSYITDFGSFVFLLASRFRVLYCAAEGFVNIL